MCGPFKSCQAILRLLEIIFTALAFIIVTSRGGMVHPWGVWCEFVWIFCIIVPLVLLVMEAMSWHILLATCLPDWADLSCGLTMLCAAMITSATIIFAVVYLCLSCIINILCLIFSLVATVVFLVDTVKQKLKCPNGYLSRLRGLLRMSEAFIACIILTAASDYFVNQNWSDPPFGMICSVAVFALCLLVTVLIIILYLLRLLQGLLSLNLGLMEFVFNIVVVLSYMLAIILWIVFGSKHYNNNPYFCEHCSYRDFITVIVGAFINLVLYLVDLVLSFKSR
ncbi:myeloid-associated differentiation marker-like protein 2 [Paralichthys olivaceus]|uniref:myeloid-associated differentiation marker-like protein 2 n=1 Tax=Paralichthys olivaceus TaxID=8255 RepID=UPI00097D6F00|nr:PREDICTED: myeloid-associated differentiation marker-like protein 2 [Paralichthys olivaceus]